MADELVEFKGIKYPKKIIETAKLLQEKLKTAGYEETMEDCIEEVIDLDEGLRNAKPADPNETIRAVIFIPQKERNDDS